MVGDWIFILRVQANSLPLQDADKKQFTDKINDLKKEIKTLTGKLKFLHNPTKKNQKQVQQDSALQQQKKVPLPKGAKSAEDGVSILDLQIIDLKKQNDLFHAKIVKKQQRCDKLTEEFQKLIAYKNEKNAPAVLERPPETMEEDQNRKVGIWKLNLGVVCEWCFLLLRGGVREK